MTRIKNDYVSVLAGVRSAAENAIYRDQHKSVPQRKTQQASSLLEKLISKGLKNA